MKTVIRKNEKKRKIIIVNEFEKTYITLDGSLIFHESDLLFIECPSSNIEQLNNKFYEENK